jgi:methenyltetrahydromethanopterin cyclohydrolase
VNTRLPVLIFAQSATALAISVAQAGYPVWAADCYLDSETCSVSARTTRLPPLETTSSEALLNQLIELSQGQPCFFIYGSGIEFHSNILKSLPSHFHLLGNNFDTVNAITSPKTFFKALDKLNLPYPQTTFKPPSSSTYKKWLFKPNKSLGGMHITFIDDEIEQKDGYFQHYIDGTPGSVLFVSNNASLQIVLVNEQETINTKNMPFILGSIITPATIPPPLLTTLNDAIQQLALHFNLIGFNSLDFIIKNDELYLLELNPRPSASIQLVKQPHNIFHIHKTACKNAAHPMLLKNESLYRGLFYVFAQNDYLVTAEMQWPEQTIDRPIEGTLIKKSSPICSLLLNAKSRHKLQEIAEQKTQEILSKLSPAT